MQLIVQTTPILSGQVIAPSSKSQSIRGIFLASLCKGQSILRGVLDAQDTQDAIAVCKQLGALITTYADVLSITGVNAGHRSKINCLDKIFFSGNSGIATHFIIPLLGLRQNAEQAVILDCGAQMRARSIVPLVDALRQLGLSIDYLAEHGFCPVAISGNLRGGTATMEGISSQHLSALLIALPCAQKESEITVKNLCSRPYVEMTLGWLKEQKIAYTHEKNADVDIFKIKGKQKYKKFQKIITGDFSSAASVMAAGALIPGEIELDGLNMQDAQGDKELIAILQAMGADIHVEPAHILIRGGKGLNGITIDAKDIPDLVPILAVIGTQAKGKTEIVNVKQARMKETDRIHSMTEGLRRLGAQIDEHLDGMTVHESKLIGGEIKGYGDHRSVMALAVAGMLASRTTTINEGEAVDKTFPTFIGLMQSIGAKMSAVL